MNINWKRVGIGKDWRDSTQDIRIDNKRMCLAVDGWEGEELKVKEFKAFGNGNDKRDFFCYVKEDILLLP